MVFYYFSVADEICRMLIIGNGFVISEGFLTKEILFTFSLARET